MGWLAGMIDASQDRPLRIALIPSAFLPSTGGVEQATLRLAVQLQALGHQVEVWSGQRDDDEFPRHDRVETIPVHRSPFPAPARNTRALARVIWAGPRELWHLWRWTCAFRPDVLNVHCFSTNGVYAWVLHRVTHIPLVITLHGETVMDDHDAFRRSAFLRRGLQRALQDCQEVTACSTFALNDVKDRFGLDNTRGVVTPNGVDLDEGAEPEPVDLPFDRFVLAYGRLVRNKGFDLLLEAWAAVTTVGVGLVIGGAGPALDELASRAAHRDLRGRVIFVGNLSRGQIAWLASHAEVMVVPSRVEPFGIVVLEGWRGGCAVVATKHGGTSEFVRDGVNGIFIDPLDREAFTGSLDAVLGDATLRSRIAVGGHTAVQSHGWPSAAERYVQVFRRITRDVS